MSTIVLIERRIKHGRLEAFLDALKKQRLSRRTVPGFISGKVVHTPGDRHNTLVIASWESFEDWERWYDSPERRALNHEIKDMLDSPETIKIFEESVSTSLSVETVE